MSKIKTTSKSINTGLCDRVKAVRLAERKGQAEFAQSLGLKSHSAISELERHQKEPSKTIIRQILDIYDVDEVWLYTGKGSGGVDGPNDRVVRRGDLLTIAELRPTYEAGPARNIHVAASVQWAYLELVKAAARREVELNEFSLGLITGYMAEVLVNGGTEADARKRMEGLIDLTLQERAKSPR